MQKTFLVNSHLRDSNASQLTHPVLTTQQRTNSPFACNLHDFRYTRPCRMIIDLHIHGFSRHVSMAVQARAAISSLSIHMTLLAKHVLPSAHSQVI